MFFRWKTNTMTTFWKMTDISWSNKFPLLSLSVFLSISLSVSLSHTHTHTDTLSLSLSVALSFIFFYTWISVKNEADLKDDAFKQVLLSSVVSLLLSDSLATSVRHSSTSAWIILLIDSQNISSDYGSSTIFFFDIMMILEKNNGVVSFVHFSTVRTLFS